MLTEGGINGRIWQCGKCGGWNAIGVSRCGHCGAMLEAEARAGAGWRGHAEPERAEQDALVEAARASGAVFPAGARLVVTVERHGPRKLDDDNMVGGCKQLRDASAEALGRKGDAERDGLEFRYSQVAAKKGREMTVVVIEES